MSVPVPPASFQPVTSLAFAMFALGGCNSPCTLQPPSFDAPPLSPVGGDRLCHAMNPNAPTTQITCIEFESADPPLVNAHLAQYRSMLTRLDWEAVPDGTVNQFQRRTADGKCVDFLSIGFAPGLITIEPMSRACRCGL